MNMQSQKLDLEARTTKFGEGVIVSYRNLPKDAIIKPLINQLLRTATGVGANYMESNGASLQKDCRNKPIIYKKERKKLSIGFASLSIAVQTYKNVLRALRQEVHELVLIFQKITASLKLKRLELE